MMHSLLRICRYLFSLSLLLLLISFCAPHVHADGGAPQLAYIAGASQGISVIDIAQQRVTRTIPMLGDPHVVLLSLDGHALYVTQPMLGRVTVLVAKTGKTLCTTSLPGQPSLLALSLDATVLYVAGRGDISVRALDPTTCVVRHVFETHEAIYGLAVAASTAADATPSTPNQLWIAGLTALTIFDVNGHLRGTVPIAGGPQNISIPAGFTAYVTTRQGTVIAVDLNTQRIIHTLLAGGEFGPMDYDATTGEVYVPDERHNQLDVLVPVTAEATTIPHEPTRILHLGASPQSVAITSDGQLGFVALSNGHTLMLDIPQRYILTSITVGGTPHFIITGLYPPDPVSPSKDATTTSQGFVIRVLAVLATVVVTILLVVLWLFRRRSQKQFIRTPRRTF